MSFHRKNKTVSLSNFPLDVPRNKFPSINAKKKHLTKHETNLSEKEVKNEENSIQIVCKNVFIRINGKKKLRITKRFPIKYVVGKFTKKIEGARWRKKNKYETAKHL